MSYATIETAAVTTLRLHDDFDSTNCTAGDRRPIAKGYERAASIKYGNLRREEISVTLRRHIWILYVDLIVPYRGEISDMEVTLATERQKVVDTYMNSPRLSNCSGVTRAEIINGDHPEPLMTKKTAYRGQRLYLEVHETAKVTIAV